MKYVVQRVQEQVIDADELLFGDDDEFDAVVAIEVAESFDNGWSTVDLNVIEVDPSEQQ